MLEMSHSQFIDSAVAIDAQHFSHCVFKNCTLIYSGGQIPSFNSCTFDGVRFSFQGAAGATLSFMAILHHMGFKESMEQTFNSIREWKPPTGMMENNRTE